MSATLQAKKTSPKRVSTRSILLEILESGTRPAYSFGDLVTEAKRVRASIHKSTVLRNLDRLLVEGRVCEWATRGKSRLYALRSATAALTPSHTHAALCRGCPATLPLPAGVLEKLEAALKQVEAEVGSASAFAGLGHKLQFEGYCPECAPKHSLESAPADT